MVSRNAIKIHFLQQTRRRRPASVFSHRTRLLRVPDIVRSEYKCPLALNAPMGVCSGELICNGVEETTWPSFQYFTSKAEQQEWLQDIVALQWSIVQHLSAKQMPSLVLDSEQISWTNV
ncbi:PHD finger protein 12-like [Arapaima gigas]